MATRLNPRHSETVRTKIQARQLINRLTNHALGEVELSQTQIAAIKILLDKSVPNLSAVAVANVDGPEQLQNITVKLVGKDTRDSGDLPNPVPTEPIQSILGREGSGEVMELRYITPGSSDTEAIEGSLHEGSTGVDTGVSTQAIS